MTNLDASIDITRSWPRLLDGVTQGVDHQPMLWCIRVTVVASRHTQYIARLPPTPSRPSCACRLEQLRAD